MAPSWVEAGVLRDSFLVGTEDAQEGRSLLCTSISGSSGLAEDAVRIPSASMD